MNRRAFVLSAGAALLVCVSPTITEPTRRRIITPVFRMRYPEWADRERYRKLPNIRWGACQRKYTMTLLDAQNQTKFTFRSQP